MRQLLNIARHTYRCWRAKRAAMHATRRLAEAVQLLDAALEFAQRASSASAFALANFDHELTALQAATTKQRRTHANRHS